MITKDKRVCVVGLGYIGLPTAALISSKGYEVVGVDVSKEVVDTINRGKIHIVEPGLLEVVETGVRSGNLKASLVPCSADVFILCVPTPFKKINEILIPDLSYVEKSLESIMPYLRGDEIVILESTSPVGTSDNLNNRLAQHFGELNCIKFAYCPERVLPGNIMAELVENDRIIGGCTPQASGLVANLYKTFVSGKVIETDARTAEMCKLTENSFRDVNIAFANELSIICGNNGINVFELIKLANLHPRVSILNPGIGVGGHCIAVDPWFIIAQDPENSKLIKTARETNLAKTEWVIGQIINHLGPPELGKKFACLGLAFKPNIDDLRESPAVVICDALYEKGYRPLVVEPNISEHPKFELVDMYHAIDNSDCLVLNVLHDEFKVIKSGSLVDGIEILDFCGLLS
jgi:UDP-N-acetyl-D-mannosaminuronic acid dehydrogenase